MSALPSHSDRPVTEVEFPCSRFQSGLLHHAERFGTALNATFRFKLEGYIEAEIVRRALQALVDRHEILRTTFHKSGSGFVQQVHGSATLPFSAVDLSGADPAAIERLCDAIGGKEVGTPFDLAEPPLSRAALVRTGPRAALLLLTFHSSVIDGWSVGLLSQEFIDNARDLSAGRPFVSAPVDLHYGDFTLWQQAAIDGPAAMRERAYWERQLDGLARFTVPHDREERREGISRSDIIAVVVDRPITDAMEAFAKETGKTLFHVATASLALALRRLTGADEVVISTPVALRDEEEAEAVVGPLLNTVVLRLPTKGEQTVLDTIDLTVNTISDAMANKALPLEEVVPPQANDAFPVCPINFTMLRSLGEFAFGKEMSTGRFTASTLPSQSGGAVWDLNFFMVDRADGWRLSLEGNMELYDRSTLTRILDVWRETFVSVTARLAETLDDFGGAVSPARTAKTPSGFRLVTTNKAAKAGHDARILHLGTEGAETPIVVINIGGVLRRLAERLPERRFVDIAFWGPLDLPRAEPTLDDFVDEAVELIRAAVPTGPYIVGGECFAGSTIAVEAARRLRQAGESVELFVVFDGWAAGYRESLPSLLKRWRKFRINFARWRREGGIWPNLLRYFEISGPKPTPPELSADEKKTRHYRHILITACEQHRPVPLDVPMLLFRTDEALNGIGFRYDMGWREVAGSKLVIEKLPGSHHQAYDDLAAPIVAGKIRDMARQVAAPSPAAGTKGSHAPSTAMRAGQTG